MREQANRSYVVSLANPDEAKAKQIIAQATAAITMAKNEGRTISLDKAESLLQQANQELVNGNCEHAISLAYEARGAADHTITWLIMPVTTAFGEERENVPSND